MTEEALAWCPSSALKMTQLSLLLSLSFLRRHQPNYFSHELVITVIFFKNTMQEMSCHAAFSCRKRNNSFVCVVNNEDFFFHRGKQFLVPSICFALHTTLALRALDDLSIPMYVLLYITQIFDL